MVYLFGFFGFCAGFYAGLMMLKPLLRGKSNLALKTDRSLALKYGWIVWIVALLGCALGIYGYDAFLLG
ncbi:MAG: hypothetical protein H6855_01210 [Rhodospirillales bacterium]|nr:hypothetical protein [Rhodospirillales bacterium]MCB9964688.1 hypothetical protein [Rhodospirillales bacterium]MCB9979978.1 hypothetical protein [Rhodospirillales bacterium]